MSSSLDSTTKQSEATKPDDLAGAYIVGKFGFAKRNLDSATDTVTEFY
jgi:hypothetical protein